MAREARTKEIKGAGDSPVTYTVNLLPPSQALDLLMDLVKMLGPAFAPVFANLATLQSFMDRDVADLRTDFLGEAVKALCSGIDKDLTKRSIKTLAGVTVVESGGPLDKCFEAFFAREGLGAMFQWVAFALQAQYDDFLADFGNAIRSAPLPRATKPQA